MKADKGKAKTRREMEASYTSHRECPSDNISSRANSANNDNISMATGQKMEFMRAPDGDRAVTRGRDDSDEMEEQEWLDQEAAGNQAQGFLRIIFREVAAQLTQVINENPKDPISLSKRAICYIRSGALAKGLEDANKCIGLDPTLPEGYVLKAELQFCMGNYQYARASYLEGFKRVSKNSEFFNLLKDSRPAACVSGDARADELIIKDRELDRLTDKLQIAIKHIEDLEQKLSEFTEHRERLLRENHNLGQRLNNANNHFEDLQRKLKDSTDDCIRFLRENHELIEERNNAVRETDELRKTTNQMLSVLSTKMYSEFSSSQLESATQKFSASQRIGQGGFGVYKGTLRCITVAIKVPKDDTSLQKKEEAQRQFLQEVSILSRVKHPHIVTLLGACSETCALVFEFMQNGSLEGFLGCPNKKKTLTWQVRIGIVREIRLALIFLHKNEPCPIAHGDLKPDNILLDANLVSKLCDFGRSRHLIHYSGNNSAIYQTDHFGGTFGYIDPEFTSQGTLTPQSDVYSFGVVVLRLLTGKPPKDIKKIVEAAMKKDELSSVIDFSAGEWPHENIQKLVNLALQCTAMTRDLRPDLSSEVWKIIEAMTHEG